MPTRIYRSSLPPIRMEEIDVLTFILSNPMRTADDKPVFIDAVSGEARTYGDIQQRTRSLAQGLRDLGVRPRDIVALFSPNSIDYAITCYAVLGCGATVSPVSAAYTPMELQAQLETSGATYLITHSSLLAIAEGAVKFNPSIRIIQADGDKDKQGRATAETLARTCPPSPLVSIEPHEAKERLAFLCFSSGTTGRSKGVMTTHYNLVSNIKQWMAHMPQEMTGNLTTVTFLPFSHIYGLTNFVGVNTYVGQSAVVLGRFELELFLSRCQQYRPQSISLVPPVMLLLAKHSLVEKYDLSSLKRLICAAAPLSVELRQAVEARFKTMYGTTLLGLQAWGLTETSPFATAVPAGRSEKRHTVGNILPNMEYRVVDPDTLQDSTITDDGSSAPGEIWCRGPNVTKGYYRNEEATKNSFVMDEDDRVWFRTGDVGMFDNERFLIIVDRIKEIFKYKGMQVVPSELEGKLLEHPDVEDACIVPQWVEEQATHLPVGFVALTQTAKVKGEKEAVEGIHSWLNARVANHKKLRGGIFIVDAIPKTPSGKILRREVAQILKAQSAKNGSRL